MKNIKKLFSTDFDLDVKKDNVKKLATAYFQESYDDLVDSCDKVFVGLMLFQWLFSVGLAYWFSPLTYSGLESKIHYHVWLALFGGGFLALVPTILFFLQPRHIMNRYVNVVSQGLFSALLIHLTGGRIETHFHVFGSLAFFAFYRDLKVLAVGTLVVAGDHLIRGIWFPTSVFGIVDASQWRWLEHAAWVVFEDFFLAYACIKSLEEMKIVALKRAETEDQKNSVEEIVEVRTGELSNERNSMKTVLDTIDQGLFMVDKTGHIFGRPSKKASQLFEESDILGKKFAKVILRPENEFDDLLDVMFTGALHPDSVINLLPSKVKFNEKTIKFSYKPVMKEDHLDSLLVAGTDVTEIEKLQRESERSEERNKAIVKILSTKNEFIEAIQMVNQIGSYRDNFSMFKRQLHTLKGAFAFLDCRSLAQHCHEIENAITKDRQYFQEKSQEIVNDLKGKLQLFIEENNNVLRLNADSQSIEIELPKVTNVIRKFKSIDPSMTAVAEIDELMKVELRDELSWLSDAFQQACEKLGKECLPIEFSSSALIPTQTYKSLFKSFIHIVRNAADHGIEDAAEREMLEKDRAGGLSVTLLENSTHYELIFKDDGRGVDLDQLRKKLGEGAEKLSDEEVLDGIFKSGVSTKDVVTETSGRGVGLDAVRYEAELLNGKCWAVNHAGLGLEIHVQFKKLNFSDVCLPQAPDLAA